VQKFAVAGWANSLVTDWNAKIADLVGNDIKQSVIATWICPTCPRTHATVENNRVLAKGNYVGLMGPWRVGRANRRDIGVPGQAATSSTGDSFDNNRYLTLTNKQMSCDTGDYGGLFFQGHPQFESYAGFQPGLQHIADGTSNCLMISERDGGTIPGTTTQRLPTSWFGPGLPQAVSDVTFSTYYSINTPGTQPGGSQGESPCHSCAASKQTGGVNVTLADASGRFVSETIDTTVWRFMGDREDGHAITLP
jgi:hypothetical protein